MKKKINTNFIIGIMIIVGALFLIGPQVGLFSAAGTQCNAGSATCEGSTVFLCVNGVYEDKGVVEGYCGVAKSQPAQTPQVVQQPVQVQVVTQTQTPSFINYIVVGLVLAGGIILAGVILK